MANPYYFHPIIFGKIIDMDILPIKIISYIIISIWKTLRHGRSTPERKTQPHNHYSKNKNPNLRTELAAVLKLNQVDL